MFQASTGFDELVGQIGETKKNRTSQFARVRFALHLASLMCSLSDEATHDTGPVQILAALLYMEIANAIVCVYMPKWHEPRSWAFFRVQERTMP